MLSIVGSSAMTWAQTPVNATQHATTEDSRLRALYTAEDAWRKAQRGAPDEDRPQKILAELPSVDAATQQAKLKHWQGVLRQVDALKPATLSETAARQLPGLPRAAHRPHQRPDVPRVRASRELRFHLLVR